MIDHIDELKGQRVVVQGVFHRPDRAFTMLTDCRTLRCPGGKVGLVVGGAPNVDTSFDRLLATVEKQPIREMIVVLEGTTRVEDNPFERPPASIIVIDVSRVRSMKSVHQDGTKRSNDCDGE